MLSEGQKSFFTEKKIILTEESAGSFITVPLIGAKRVTYVPEPDLRDDLERTKDTEIMKKKRQEMWTRLCVRKETGWIARKRVEAEGSIERRQMEQLDFEEWLNQMYRVDMEIEAEQFAECERQEQLERENQTERESYRELRERLDLLGTGINLEPVFADDDLIYNFLRCEAQRFKLDCDRIREAHELEREQEEHDAIDERLRRYQEEQGLEHFRLDRIMERGEIESLGDDGEENIDDGDEISEELNESDDLANITTDITDLN